MLRQNKKHYENLKKFILSCLIITIIPCFFTPFLSKAICESDEVSDEFSFYEQWSRTRGTSSYFGLLPDTSVAISDDAYALWNNPAGIHFQSKSKKTGSFYLSMSQYQREQDSWDFVSSACFGGFGFGYSRLKNRDSDFRLDTYAIGSKFNIKDLFSIGFALKRYNSTFEKDGEDYGFDGGLLVRPHPHLSFGFTVRNINEPHFGDYLDIDRSYITGVALRPFNDRLTLAVDWTFREGIKPNDYIFDFRMETEIVDGILLNAFMDNDKNFGLTVGINFPYSGFSYTNRTNVDFENYQHQYTVKLFSDRKRSFLVPLKDDVVEIVLEGELEDFMLKTRIFKREEVGIQRKIASIRKAADMPEIKGLLITIKPLKAGMFGQLAGVAQEVREAILYAREKGKKVVAFIEGEAGTVEYYIAACADKIVMPQFGVISGLGTYISIVRIKDFLKKIGVGLDYQTVGKYKSTFHQIADEATPEQQEEIESIITDLYNQLLESIQVGRNLNRSDVEKICDGSIYSPAKAREIGLIDACGYKKDAIAVLNELTGLYVSEEDIQEKKIDTIYDYHADWGIPPKIAIIGAYGNIQTGESGEDFIFRTKTMGSDTIIEQLKKAKNDKLVKAVILRVDSGGGSGIASDLIYNMINEVKASGKKVVISMADVAGSGGYWISAPGDVILANPATITGSIGVMSAKFVLEDLFDKLDIKSEIYKKGEHSDMSSWLRPYTEKERVMVKELMEHFYDIFIEKVASSRNLSVEEVRKAAEGRVYTGNQALKIKLVDEMGGLTRAIEVTKDIAGITEEPEIVVYLPKRSFLMNLIGETIIQQLNLDNLFSNELLQLRMNYPGH